MSGSPAQWRELALASMKVCYYRPHPREWWDGDMKEDSEKEYDAACKRMGELKKELGLENAEAHRSAPAETVERKGNDGKSN